jgi:hypothetical protein
VGVAIDAARDSAVGEMITLSNFSPPGIHDFFEFSDRPIGKHLDLLPAEFLSEFLIAQWAVQP